MLDCPFFRNHVTEFVWWFRRYMSVQKLPFWGCALFLDTRTGTAKHHPDLLWWWSFYLKVGHVSLQMAFRGACDSSWLITNHGIGSKNGIQTKRHDEMIKEEFLVTYSSVTPKKANHWTQLSTTTRDRFWGGDEFVRPKNASCTTAAFLQTMFCCHVCLLEGTHEKHISNSRIVDV